MVIPTTLADLNRMVQDGVQESVHLDYKASPALGTDSRSRNELAKDVSALANSDGGVLVYGIEEIQHRPERLDGGLDPHLITREWIENIIRSTISPPIDDVRIYPIEAPTGSFYYSIHSAKTYRGPHQALFDKRYYKRHNFQSLPMEDYEIVDVRTRSRRYPPLITFRVSEYGGFIAVFDILNTQDVIAEDVQFDFSIALSWPDDKDLPPLLRNGMKRFSPGQHFRFRYRSFQELLAENSTLAKEFSCRISYVHPVLGSRISDEWYINFEAHRDSMIYRSDLDAYTKRGVDALELLVRSVQELDRTLQDFKTIRGATGLDLSLGTIIGLRRAIHDRDPERIDPRWQRWDTFREVLNVNVEVASKLESACRTDRLTVAGIAEVPGVTPELLVKFRSLFHLPEDEDASGVNA
jgi:hypothetical protein